MKIVFYNHSINVVFPSANKIKKMLLHEVIENLPDKI